MESDVCRHSAVHTVYNAEYKVYNEIFHTHFTGFSCVLAPTSQLCRLCVCLWQCVLHLVPRVSVCLSVRPAAHKQSALVCWFLRVHDCERSCVNRVQRMDVAKMSGWHAEGLLMFFPLPGNFPPVLKNSVSPRGKRGFQVGAKCCWQRSWKSRAVTGFLLISLSCVSCFFRSLCIFLNPLFCRNLRYKKSADTHGYTSTFFARRWPRHLQQFCDECTQDTRGVASFCQTFSFTPFLRFLKWVYEHE